MGLIAMDWYGQILLKTAWDKSRWIALLLTTSTKGRKWNRTVKRARGLGFKVTVSGAVPVGNKTNEGVPGEKPIGDL